MPSTPFIRAAQYLRMSTEGQKYSLDNQAAAIRQYAIRQGFEVIKTYSDAGKSGLVFRSRAGLKQLLEDVVSGGAEYEAILVYDISRWGRFQDSDEAAYYEFVCKSAGVPVYYCAEQFTNDGSMPSLIMKALKRTMAAEFSRELGEKVFAGKCRLAALGYRMGGNPGYGLRRVMVAADGRHKQQLATGERKSLTTDHVVLVPGPAQEVKWVRWIYSQALQHQSSAAIYRELNLRNVPGMDGKPWNVEAVRQILKNPKYAGCNFWARSTQRLRTLPRRTPPEQWVTRENAFSRIIDRQTFDRVQKILRNSTRNKSDGMLLHMLKCFWKSRGRLSVTMIERSRTLPALSTYVNRFGSIKKVYELIGYRPPPVYALRTERAHVMKTLRKGVVAEIQKWFPHAAIVPQRLGNRPVLEFPGAGRVIIVVCRYASTPWTRRKYWILDTRRTERQLPTLVCLLSRRNDAMEEFYVMPDIDALARLTLTRHDPWFKRGIHLRSLAELESALLQIRTAPPIGPVKRRFGCNCAAHLMPRNGAGTGAISAPTPIVRNHK